MKHVRQTLLLVLPVALLTGCACKTGDRYLDRCGCGDVIQAYRDWDHAHPDWEIPLKNLWCDRDRR
jgi:outer membrane biogenesis lipoprotein LolB